MHKTVMTVSSAICSGLLGLALCGALQVPAEAQTQRPATPAERTSTAPSRTLNMGVGKSVIIDLPRDAAEIFVGDPKVVSAVVRSARKLYIIASSVGQTSLHTLDAQGTKISEIQISVGRDVEELDNILRVALPNSSVTTRTIDNTIILGGVADSLGEAQKAEDIAKGFLGQNPAGGTSGTVINSITVRGRDQVMLKVTVAEVSRKVMKQLGVGNALARGSWGAWTMDNAFGTLQDLTTGSLQLGSKGATGSSIFAEIKAYERNGVARVLSEPTVTAMSGESAKFTAGGEIPIPQSQSCSGSICTISVAFKPYGVGLNFTPVVLGEGRILLRIATEVTEVDPTQSVVIGGVAVSGMLTRKNETTVELPSGASIVTAGLIQSLSKQSINGLPGLMNLPVLGALFRSRDFERQETELMIVVTPYLARSVKPQDIARPADGFSDATDPQAVILGRINRLYTTPENPQVIKNFKGKVGFIAD